MTDVYLIAIAAGVALLVVTETCRRALRSQTRAYTEYLDAIRYHHAVEVEQAWGRGFTEGESFLRQLDRIPSPN